MLVYDPAEFTIHSTILTGNLLKNLPKFKMMRLAIEKVRPTNVKITPHVPLLYLLPTKI